MEKHKSSQLSKSLRAVGVLGDYQHWVGGRASAMPARLVHVGRRKSEETELMMCRNKKEFGVISVRASVCVCVWRREEVEAVLARESSHVGCEDHTFPQRGP